MSRRYRYHRMTGQQLSDALNQLGLSKFQFVRASGFSYQKVERWLADKEDIPHTATVIVTLLTLPGAVEKARVLADAMVLPDEDSPSPIQQETTDA